MTHNLLNLCKSIDELFHSFYAKNGLSRFGDRPFSLFSRKTVVSHKYHSLNGATIFLKYFLFAFTEAGVPTVQILPSLAVLA